MKRVLFVDDEPRILMALRRSLRSFRNQWETVFVEGGAAALEQCASAPFDVVVSDARMPGMEGSELLSEVMGLYPDTVRMILSGQCSRDSVLNCVAVAHQFLSKPCDPEILKSAVQRVCKMRGAFHNRITRVAISRIQRLPSQARTCRELADEIESPKACIGNLADIIARDVGMTAKVVHLVSSGFFGSPQRVMSTAQAVKLLGLETIRSLYASSAVFQPHSKEYREEDLELLTDHSLAVAAAARQIAETLTDDPVVIGDAYMAGVLHEVGTLALAGCGHRYPQEQGFTTSCHRVGSTEAHPGGADPDPGGYLVALWGLPDPVVQAIAYHRDPGICHEPASGSLTAVHVANALLEQYQDSLGENTGRLAMDYLQRAGCADRLESWREVCRACQPKRVPQ